LSRASRIRLDMMVSLSVPLMKNWFSMYTKRLEASMVPIMARSSDVSFSPGAAPDHSPRLLW